MKAFRIIAALMGLFVTVFVGICTPMTFYTSEPWWQPLAVGTLFWIIFVPAIWIAVWIVDHA